MMTDNSCGYCDKPIPPMQARHMLVGRNGYFSFCGWRHLTMYLDSTNHPGRYIVTPNVPREPNHKDCRWCELGWTPTPLTEHPDNHFWFDYIKEPSK